MKLCKWKHKTTGKIYYLIDDHVINESNDSYGEVMVTYYHRNINDKHPKRFTKNKQEFESSFELVGCV